ncbi:unnamed protein product [Dovyalis caffra]|uniref:Uncharacterized protein n=1 Tax=Dovyalis caffra TaxID=77055 RepID=A0AAV1RIH3_9ROSI|nr:unnamed protein product [Dovyalis caffra]
MRNEKSLALQDFRLPRGSKVYNVGLSNMLGSGCLLPCPIATLFCLRLMEASAKQTPPCFLIRRLAKIMRGRLWATLALMIGYLIADQAYLKHEYKASDWA